MLSINISASARSTTQASAEPFAPPYLAATLDSLAKPSRAAQSRHGAHRAVVILGVPTQPNGTPGPALQVRIDCAARWLKQYPDAIAIPTGAAVMTARIEAHAISCGLQAQGIAPSRIFAEPVARTTQANAQQVMRMLAEPRHTQINDLRLVCEPYQAVRGLRAFLQAQHRLAPHRRIETRLALTGRINIQQAAAYNPVKAKPVAPAHAAPVLARLTPSRRTELMRCLQEKLKLSWGY